MAGKIVDNRVSSDILFDLTQEDVKKLSESDLISLVNYGQVVEDVKVPSENGGSHVVQFSLLWDEDYIDIFKKTTQYSDDVLLRSRVLRRLKLHKSILRIDGNDYSDKDNPTQQRALWTILCRLADVQIEILHNKYEEIEMQRNLKVREAILALEDKFDNTSKLLKRTKSVEEKEPSVESHEQLVEEKVEAPKAIVSETLAAIDEVINTGSVPVVTSPKQKV